MPKAHTMKKALRETQTVRAGCSKAETKIFVPSQTPFPGARDGQNLISWRWTFTVKVQTQFGEDRCTQFRVIVVTDPQTNKQTQPQIHKQDRLQYTAPQLARSVIINKRNNEQTEKKPERPFLKTHGNDDRVEITCTMPAKRCLRQRSTWWNVIADDDQQATATQCQSILGEQLMGHVQHGIAPVGAISNYVPVGALQRWTCWSASTGTSMTARTRLLVRVIMRTNSIHTL